MDEYISKLDLIRENYKDLNTNCQTEIVDRLYFKIKNSKDFDKD